MFTDCHFPVINLGGLKLVPACYNSTQSFYCSNYSEISDSLEPCVFGELRGEASVIA